MVFQQWKKSNELLISGVSAMERRAKQLLNGVVSSMGKCEELLNSGVSAMEENGGKFAGQWCFSNGENGKRLLTVVFQQWGKW
jgi:hypothetical protein